MQDFDTAMNKMAEHLETKARLTQAEKLLRTADVVIKRQRSLLVERSSQIEAAYFIAAEHYNKLTRVPRWIRKLFRADFI